MRRIPEGIAEQFRIPPGMSAYHARDEWETREVKRVEVQSFDGLDMAWLDATLARIAHSVYFRRDEPDVSVAWEWPLRIGLLEGDRSEELSRSLESSSLAKLVRFVTLGGSARECELLLIPRRKISVLKFPITEAARISAPIC